MLVGRLRDGRVTFLFVGMVVGGRGAPWCRQPVGRRSRFDPCTPGWFGVGRLACGLFMVKWRLQLRCGLRAVVLAASWSAWFAWVPSRCCRWSYRRMLCVAGTSVSVVVSCVLVCPSVVLCSLLTLVGRVRNGSVAVFCCVRGYGRRQVWRTTVSPTRWTPFALRPVHAWLVWCWPACVWSVYGQVAAAAAVWLVRGCLGRLMVGLVCVGPVALLPVVVSPNVICVAGTSVSVLVSCVLVCPSVV